MGFQRFGERPAGELTALIRIEYLGGSMARQGLLQSIDAEDRPRVLKTRQANTRRLCQSMMTTRYMNPRAKGM